MYKVFREEDALEAGRLRRDTRHLGLSLGDRACLALGLRLGLPILHADEHVRSVFTRECLPHHFDFE